MVAAEVMLQSCREGEETTGKVKKKNCGRTEEEESRWLKSIGRPDNRRKVEKAATADWGTVTKQTEQTPKSWKLSPGMPVWID